MLPPARVVYSSIFLLLVMAAVVLTKPSQLFLADGSVRPFGIEGGDATPLPLGAIVVIVALGGMFIFSAVDVVYARGAPSQSHGIYPPH